MERFGGQAAPGAAALGWLGVGLYGVREIAGEEAGDGWQRPYLLYSIALFAAAALTLAVGWAATRGTGRTGLRRVGLGVGTLALASTAVAWALPLWMTLLAASFVVLSAAAPRSMRLRLTALAAAQLVGLVVLMLAIEAEVGHKDSYGDYPAAAGICLVVTAALSALAVIGLARMGPAATPRAPSDLDRRSPALP